MFDLSSANFTSYGENVSCETQPRHWPEEANHGVVSRSRQYYAQAYYAKTSQLVSVSSPVDT